MISPAPLSTIPPVAPTPDTPLWKDILQVLNPGTPYQHLVPTEGEAEECAEIIEVFLDFFFSDPFYGLSPYSDIREAVVAEVEKARCAHLPPVANSPQVQPGASCTQVHTGAK